MNLREFFHAPAVMCSPAMSLADVASRMKAEGVGSVVVTDEQGGLAGIITGRDLAIKGLADRREPNTPVRELMTPNIVFLREDASVFAAATEMVTAGCRRLPVLDMQSRIAGVIALDDLPTLFARQTDKLAEVAALEMPHAASS